ncbi:MAG: EF-hand domain-containing protein, partial [Thermoguttaceae bacterium]
VAVLGIVLWASLGCSDKNTSRIHPPAIDANAAQKAMELYDTNKDGLLDKSELEKVPGLNAAIKTVDTNNDGKISADEISARIEFWQKSRVGRRSMTCTVKHNGQPLAGATVNFVPESFLGTGLPTGVGTTGPSGTAPVNAPAEGDVPAMGMPSGFYRVEITKSGENIPAKYNTATTLGAEVAPGTRSSEIVFDLQY